MKPAPERIKLNIALDKNEFHYRQTPEAKTIVLSPCQTIEMEMDCPFSVTFRDSEKQSPFSEADQLEIQADKPSEKWNIKRTVRSDAPSGRYPFKVTAKPGGKKFEDAPTDFVVDDPEIIIETV